MRKNGSFGICNIYDLSEPYQEAADDTPSNVVEMSPDCPCILWKTDDKGWVVLDSEGNILY